MRIEEAADGTFRLADGGLQPVTTPSAATRSAIRRLVDPQTRDCITRAADVVAAARPGTAVANDVLTLEDLKSDWLRIPVVRLIQAVSVLSSDHLDNKSIGGGTLKRRLKRVAARAREVADLYDFLSCFHGEMLSEVWLPVARASVEAATHLQTALTADTDGASAQALDLYETVRRHFEEELYPLLASIPHLTSEALDLDVPATLEDYLSKTFGVQIESLDTTATGAWLERVQRSGLNPQELVESRFAFLDSLDFSDEEFLLTYSHHAFRLASSEFPLLAHRSLQLTSRVLSAADATDQQQTRDLVNTFFITEASWVVAAAPAYESALRDFIDNDDLPAIVEALRRLSEGVLRPYGSLVAAVAAIPGGSAATSKLAVAPTLGDLEQRLDRERSDIEALILPLIRREWRNADAHARATVSPTGQLILRLDDGSIEQVNPNRIHSDVAMLRAALTGIDAAVNIFFATKTMMTADLDLSPLSREMVRNLVVESVYRMGQGPVSDVVVSEEVLRVTLVRQAPRGELETMLFWLGRITKGQYKEVSAVDEEGKILATVVRLSPEPMHRDDSVYLPEWLVKGQDYAMEGNIPQALPPVNMGAPCKCGHAFSAHVWRAVKRRIRIRQRHARYRDAGFECTICECQKFRGTSRLRYS